MFGNLLRKLRACKHENTNIFDYIRNSGTLDDLIATDDYKQRQQMKEHFVCLRFCLNCGATQRYRLIDPLGLNNPKEKEPWLAPWLWRK